MKQAYIPKKRNTGKRKRKSIILLSAEGDNKTEYLYFSRFRSDAVNIRFARGNDTDPLHLVNNLINDYKDLEMDSKLGDAAFCVVDGDLSAVQENNIAKAEKKLMKINGTMIVSNPCFEVWFLCHFDFSTRQFAPSQEVIEALRKHIPDYTKSHKNIYGFLEGEMNTAVSNAKQLEKYHIRMKNPIRRYDCQPRTDVYKVIEFIYQMNTASK